jgi:hypothetical protein
MVTSSMRPNFNGLCIRRKRKDLLISFCFYFLTRDFRKVLHILEDTTQPFMEKEIASIRRLRVISVFHMQVVEFDPTVPL